MFCTICSKPIPKPSFDNSHLLADHYVYDRCGDLDYIEIAHRSCAVDYNERVESGYWTYDTEVDS